MRFVQEQPDWNHRTDDAAKIYFRHTADAAPTHLRCVGMGYTLLSTASNEFDVELAAFELIGVGNFGEPRSCGWNSHTKWTGESHRYGVYKHRRKLLIVESHGSGEQGYYDDSSHAIELFDSLCTTLRPERIWDVCYQIATTENRAYAKGRQEIVSLFLENRLKRRKRKGRYELEILPAGAAKI